MKKLIISSVVLAVIAISGVIFYLKCLKTVSPTQEGVYISQPFFFGKDEVIKDAVSPGRHFVWPSDKLLLVDSIPITVSEPFDDIASSDNVPMDFRLHVKLRLRKGKAPQNYKNVGGDAWWDSAVKEELRTHVRNVVRGVTSDNLRLDVATVTKCQDDIRSHLRTLMNDEGIEYDILDVSIGGVTPPREFLTEAALTAAQKQRKKTQKARGEAEVERANAEKKAALADQAYMQEMKMTVSEYIQRKAVENQANMIKMVAKKENVTVIMGNAVPSVSAIPK